MILGLFVIMTSNVDKIFYVSFVGLFMIFYLNSLFLTDLINFAFDLFISPFKSPKMTGGFLFIDISLNRRFCGGMRDFEGVYRLRQ